MTDVGFDLRTCSVFSRLRGFRARVVDVSNPLGESYYHQYQCDQDMSRSQPIIERHALTSTRLALEVVIVKYSFHKLILTFIMELSTICAEEFI